jgi:hypothetical protein
MFPHLRINETSAQVVGDRNAVVSIFHKVMGTDLHEMNGFPAVFAGQDKNLHPTILQGFPQGMEPRPKILTPANASDDLLKRDFLQAEILPVGEMPGSVAERRQRCGAARKRIPYPVPEPLVLHFFEGFNGLSAKIRS